MKPFYKIPLFYLAIVFLVGVGFGGGWIVKGKVQKTSIKDCEPCGVSNPIVIPKSDQSVVPGTGAYSGWDEFSDSAFLYKLNYPPTWTLEKTATDQVTITTPDQKFALDFALVKSAEKAALPDQVLYKGLTLADAGKITILETSLKKQKAVDGDQSKQYFYPYGSAETKDGSYVFSASFSPVSAKSISDVNLEDNDYRPVAEKILGSIELK